MMGQFTLDETSYTASEQFYIVLLYYIELRCIQYNCIMHRWTVHLKSEYLETAAGEKFQIR